MATSYGEKHILARSRKLDVPSAACAAENLIASISEIYEAVAADVFFDWKHSRQNTGRPCVGLNGTVVSFSHPEQIAFVSTLL